MNGGVDCEAWCEMGSMSRCGRKEKDLESKMVNASRWDKMRDARRRSSREGSRREQNVHYRTKRFWCLQFWRATRPPNWSGNSLRKVEMRRWASKNQDKNVSGGKSGSCQRRGQTWEERASTKSRKEAFMGTRLGHRTSCCQNTSEHGKQIQDR